MENKLQYLKDLAKKRPDDVWRTWQSLGSLTVSSDTKFYSEGTLFLISLKDLEEEIFDGGELSSSSNSTVIDFNSTINSVEESSTEKVLGALVYCNHSYSVSNTFPAINWEETPYDRINDMVSLYQGVNLPHFSVILSPDEVQAVKTTSFNPDFVPFQNNEISKPSICIDDSELEIILAEAGVPFLSYNELEYTRETILNICIKPALQTYFKFFPLIEEQVLGYSGTVGTEFKVELPEDAYNAVVYYTLGGAAGSGHSMSPFAYYASEVLGGGNPSGSTFGSGVSYRKQVPGFTGLPQARDITMMGLQARQGYVNQFRRERVTKVKENGKTYVKGFSTVGGTLNAKFFKYSNDWNMVEFEHLDEVRQLCQSYVLRNLAQLRSLVKSDVDGAIDWNSYTTRADNLYDRVTKRWTTTTENLAHAIQRGGL